MIQIPLTKGYVAVVDECDAHLATLKWMVVVKRTRFGVIQVYATRGAGKTRLVLHRAILNAPHGTQVDHIDGDTMNNRRSNLRLCNNSENCCNKSIRRDSRTGFKGVIHYKRIKKFGAKIQKDGRSYWLGVFPDKESAARAYDAAAMKLHGEFARVNFPVEAR